ncbi:MAG: hypothetical protein FD160_4001, partial [Caulobacteraceae bacterium]
PAMVMTTIVMFPVMMMTVVVIMTVIMQMVMIMMAMGGVVMRLSIALLGLVFDDARPATADSAHQATSSSMRRKSSPRVI